MKGGYFTRPVLKFKEGTALTPLEGFRIGYKPYSIPSLKRILSIVPTHLSNVFNSLWENLWNGVKGYNGLRNWFPSTYELPKHEVIEINHYDYAKVVESELPHLEDVDIILLVVPDKMMVPYDKDPYVPYKRILSLHGYPSQMLSESTIKYSFDNPYVLFNVALSIFTKTGGIPWSIDTPWEDMLFIGIDSTQRNDKRFFALTAVYGIPKIKFFWTLESITNPSEKLSADAMKDMIKTTVEKSKENISNEIRRVIIHRDGLVFDEEILGTREAIAELKAENILPKEIKYALISIKKRGTPKIFKLYAKNYGTPDKGLYIVLGYEKGFVVTTGFPEFGPFSPMGKINPLNIEIADSNFEISIRDIMKEIYYLSELHFASGLRSAKLPITILFSDRIAKFAYSNVIPSERLQETLWFL